MFVRVLAHNQGMLFPQDPPRVMAMWMRNTWISLDILFVDNNGRITYIKDHATPMSDDIITDPTPVASVIELAAGECALRGIRVGDNVRVH